MDNIIGATTPTTLTKASLKQKLSNREREALNINVLDYWKRIHYQEPEIGKLVEVALAVPATQVSFERAFSALSTIITKLRAKLSKQTINNILITKLNFDIIHNIELSCAEDDDEDNVD